MQMLWFFNIAQSQYNIFRKIVNIKNKLFRSIVSHLKCTRVEGKSMTQLINCVDHGLSCLSGCQILLILKCFG